jgi:hypothetical protein
VPVFVGGFFGGFRGGFFGGFFFREPVSSGLGGYSGGN